jgi:Berberine and berberine like
MRSPRRTQPRKTAGPNHPARLTGRTPYECSAEAVSLGRGTGLADLAPAYYGPNRDRLIRIKAQYDAQDLFRSPAHEISAARLEEVE